MTGTALETVLRRDRAVVIGALAALALLCWVYLAALASAPKREISSSAINWLAAELTMNCVG